MKDTERVYYIADISTDKVVYCGKCVNYPAINAMGGTLEELDSNIREQLEMEKDQIIGLLREQDSLEMVELMNADEWLWIECSTTKWEIERLQYLLRTREDIRQILKKIIMDEGAHMYNETEGDISIIGDNTINAIIEYKQ